MKLAIDLDSEKQISFLWNWVFTLGS